jgi:hypothetical protein
MRLEQLITGNDEVQQHVASEREKQALVAVSPMARRAIKLEILPQIEESVISVEAAEELCADTKRAIEAAFSYKNPLYTRLVSHKGIEQGDSQYLADLLLVMDEWLRNTKARLEDDKKEDESDEKAESEKQEVEVTVKVEHEAPEGELQIKDHDSGPKIEIDPAALFELGDVRL